MSPRVFTLKIENPKDEISLEELLKSYSKYCSAYRLEKINSFYKMEDKIRCAAAGFALNQLVSEVTGKPLHQLLRESADSLGRPLLLDYPELFISITHSGQSQNSYVGCALHDSPVGIDIEEISEVNKVPLKDFLHTQELTHESHPLLVKYWTAKEAYMKALGLGFQMDPKDIFIESLQEWNFSHTQMDPDFHMTYCWPKGIQL